ncbi:YqaE/Pmp3 family membrane protein [Nostoc sp. FACHB-87]|uniref:YqaE/Pmp3 family membrane protein n=1 Tax=Nostocales TaxID=1161 RepID=UPI0016835207|nr:MULTISPECIES: YqaE/Pmp3 family membrane protein [Nostocales]MBD2299092.1 YqaE/Pmp3 family membrane protein [Nostoc sp. FACHB-190]MBD2456781.1 YqaE/Pmp3 family membrane protein [Nostoc sp. FACHB-87]MBD2476450.1 YqaE/Pmp3 family membrane protein [Anabaena sp. FACHB-83]MBD2488393.1 YqaE/Pmp3 family membrane protein [Aulosira sp. FACHB-615]
MKILRFLLAIFLPPLGVFLTVGVGPTLVINILLTLLGWLPGSIHALWIVAKREEALNSGTY